MGSGKPFNSNRSMRATRSPVFFFFFSPFPSLFGLAPVKIYFIQGEKKEITNQLTAV